MNGRGVSGRGEAVAQQVAERRADRWRGRIADRLRAVGGVQIEQHGDGVAVSGRRLRARWLRDARLRWIGGWL